jgi:hypothetical protein
MPLWMFANKRSKINTGVALKKWYFPLFRVGSLFRQNPCSMIHMIQFPNSITEIVRVGNYYNASKPKIKLFKEKNCMIFGIYNANYNNQFIKEAT